MRALSRALLIAVLAAAQLANIPTARIVNGNEGPIDAPIEVIGATLEDKTYDAPYTIIGSGGAAVSHLRIFRANAPQGQIRIQASVPPNGPARVGTQCLRLVQSIVLDQLDEQCGPISRTLVVSTTVQWDEAKLIAGNCAYCPVGMSFRVYFGLFNGSCEGLPCTHS